MTDHCGECIDIQERGRGVLGQLWELAELIPSDERAKKATFERTHAAVFWLWKALEYAHDKHHRDNYEKEYMHENNEALRRIEQELANDLIACEETRSAAEAAARAAQEAAESCEGEIALLKGKVAFLEAAAEETKLLHFSDVFPFGFEVAAVEAVHARKYLKHARRELPERTAAAVVAIDRELKVLRRQFAAATERLEVFDRRFPVTDDQLELGLDADLDSVATPPPGTAAQELAAFVVARAGGEAQAIRWLGEYRTCVPYPFAGRPLGAGVASAIARCVGSLTSAPRAGGTAHIDFTRSRAGAMSWHWGARGDESRNAAVRALESGANTLHVVTSDPDLAVLVDEAMDLRGTDGYYGRKTPCALDPATGVPATHVGWLRYAPSVMFAPESARLASLTVSASEQAFLAFYSEQKHLAFVYLFRGPRATLPEDEACHLERAVRVALEVTMPPARFAAEVPQPVLR